MLINILGLGDGLFPETMAYQEFYIDLSVISQIGVFEKDGIYHETFHNMALPMKDLDSAEDMCAKLLDAVEMHKDREKIERGQILDGQNKKLAALIKGVIDGDS